MNLIDRLERARKVFRQEYDRINDRVKSAAREDQSEYIPATPEILAEMPALGIAIAVVRYFSRSQIEEFVKQGIVHPSTYAGGTLAVAEGKYDGYLSNHDPLLLSTDNLEQLYRTCATAKNIVKGRLF